MTAAILSTTTQAEGWWGAKGREGRVATGRAAIWWRLRHGRRCFTSGKQHFRRGPQRRPGATCAGGRGSLAGRQRVCKDDSCSPSTRLNLHINDPDGILDEALADKNRLYFSRKPMIRCKAPSPPHNVRLDRDNPHATSSSPPEEITLDRYMALGRSLRNDNARL